ncbi:hypothetical protein IFR05_006261 [Cadophora sp. M221]|nr:hypothetical protein IFR05_006261 [Cadophora sp. M221]
MARALLVDIGKFPAHQKVLGIPHNPSKLISQDPRKLNYVGGKTLNSNNPGLRDGTSALTLQYAGTLSTCDTAGQCAAIADSSFTQFGGGFFTFNLQFHEAAQQWVCVAYYDTTSTSYYNVDDPDVRSYS